MFESTLYPEVKVKVTATPNRFYAVPLVGMLVKGIMVIPVGILLVVALIGLAVVSIINSFIVLFTGKYWETNYKLALGALRLSTKMSAFIYGLTDLYPGFSFDNNSDVMVNMPMPTAPSRVFAIPFLGGLLRGLFLIPFSIFAQVVSYAAAVGVMLLAWAVVLFKGEYPAFASELAIDNLRVSASSLVYYSGLTDKYPSFQLNWNNKNIKIALLIVGVLLMLANWLLPRGDRHSKNSRFNSPADIQQEYQLPSYE